jgi:predicted nuclease of predicted toxin-antitoxin system
LKFKVDHNLLVEYSALLRESGFEADTVDEEALGGADDATIAERSRTEKRTLVTLDLGFSDIRSYPPAEFPGIIVLRSKAQDKDALILLLRRVIPVLRGRSPEGQLWIVEGDRIRFRG